MGWDIGHDPQGPLTLTTSDTGALTVWCGTSCRDLGWWYRRDLGRQPAAPGLLRGGGADHSGRSGRPSHLSTGAPLRALRAGRSRRHRAAERSAAPSWDRICQERDRPRGTRNQPGHPGERDNPRVRRARCRHRGRPRTGGNGGFDRHRVDGQGFHLLLTRRSRRAGRGLGYVRRWPRGRQRGGHAHQVPRRAARVLLPGRLVLSRTRHPRPGGSDLCDAARRSLYQARGLLPAGGDAVGEGHRPGDRVQHRGGGRGEGTSRRLRRSRGRLRPGCRRSTARWGSLCRPVAGSGRRVELHPHGRAHAAVQGCTERLRDRRRRQRPGLEGRIGHALRR